MLTIKECGVGLKKNMMPFDRKYVKWKKIINSQTFPYLRHFIGVVSYLMFGLSILVSASKVEARGKLSILPLQ